MSRILQALKQLENRPQPDPATTAPAQPGTVPPGTVQPNAAQPAAAPESNNARLPTMPFTPPALAGQQRPTERVAPRRKKQKEKAIRAAQREAQALATAADIQQLLTSLQPSLVECWSATDEQTHVIVEAPAVDLPLHSSPVIVQNDHLPAVVTIRERVEIPVGAAVEIQQPLVLEAWSSAPSDWSVMVEETPLSADPALASAVVVNEHLPEVIVQREIIEREVDNRPPTTSRTPTVAAELATLQAVAELRALLAASAPTVMESWTPDLALPTLVAAESADSGALEMSAPLLVSDYAPQVITVREAAPVTEMVAAPAVPAPPAGRERMMTEVIRRHYDDELAASPRTSSLSRDEIQSLLGDSPASVVELWLGDDVPSTALVEEAPAALDGDFTSVIVASDGLPAELTFSAPTTEAAAGPPEVDLDFGGTTPRRREPRRLPVTTSKARRERRAPTPTPPQERTLRQEVRRELAPRLPAPSSWELLTRARLQQPTLVAPYRQLLARWEAEAREQDLASLLIASLGEPALAGDVVLHAALLLAEAQPPAKILLIEADEEAGLARRLNLSGQLGLTDLLRPHDAHGSAIQATSTANIHLLARGREAWSPDSARQLTTLLADLSREYAWILVAGGRIATTATQALARNCRGTYVIAPLGELSAPTARQELDQLRNGGARVLGSMVVE